MLGIYRSYGCNMLGTLFNIFDDLVIIMSFCLFELNKEKPFVSSFDGCGFSKKICWFGAFVDLASDLLAFLSFGRLTADWTAAYWNWAPYKC